MTRKLLRISLEITKEVEDDSFVSDFVSFKDAFKPIITLHNFLLKYKNIAP